MSFSRQDKIWTWYNVIISKISYRKVSRLSKVQRAYIAGIIDGGGSITLTIKQKGGTRLLAVTVSNNELPLLKYLLQTVGAGKIDNKRTYKKQHRLSYTYAIYSRQALDVLKQILPYLKTYKLKRAQLALEKYLSVTPRNGKYSQRLLRKKEKFVMKFFTT